jgi:hypothetical protein
MDRLSVVWDLVEFCTVKFGLEPKLFHHRPESLLSHETVSHVILILNGIFGRLARSYA